ncbi:MAG: phosphoribosyl-AMP cyclohydrolase [bacterium]
MFFVYYLFFSKTLNAKDNPMNYMEKAKFDKNGLITAIAQDNKTAKVLMVAYMTRETLEKSLKLNKMVYWSRSRQKEWIKGETSGNTQLIKEVRFDCDGDAILFKVEQKGGACHEGWESCFAYKVDVDGKITIDGNKMFDPDKVYRRD